MKEEYCGFRPGDRIQIIECKDPYAPVLLGAKGTVEHIDDMETLHMAWDDGRTLGMCPEEDVVRKIPLEREMELLNGEPLLQCDENHWEIHCEQSVTLTSAMQSFAEKQGCDWVVKRSFIDEGHSQRRPSVSICDADSLDNPSESSDLKNGTNIGFMAKRLPSRQSMAIVAYGQGYTTLSGTYLVKELLECKLISPAATRDFRVRIDAGWDPSGKAAMSCSTPQRTIFRSSPRSSENARIFPELSAAKAITKSVSAGKHRRTYRKGRGILGLISISTCVTAVCASLMNSPASCPPRTRPPG